MHPRSANVHDKAFSLLAVHDGTFASMQSWGTLCSRPPFSRTIRFRTIADIIVNIIVIIWRNTETKPLWRMKLSLRKRHTIHCHEKYVINNYRAILLYVYAAHTCCRSKDTDRLSSKNAVSVMLHCSRFCIISAVGLFNTWSRKRDMGGKVMYRDTAGYVFRADQPRGWAKRRQTQVLTSNEMKFNEILASRWQPKETGGMCKSLTGNRGHVKYHETKPKWKWKAPGNSQESKTIIIGGWQVKCFKGEARD